MIAIYLAPQYADWEGAYLMGELAEAKRPFVTVSEDGGPVTSIGGLRATPSASLKTLKARELTAFVLIGADSWPDPSLNKDALKLAGECLEAGILVGAICAATVGLVREGLVSSRKHTSNSLGFLRAVVPTYAHDDFYVDAPVVRDGNLITAPGHRPVQFTYEILRALGVYSDEKLKMWLAMYQDGVTPPDSYWMQR